MQNKLLAKALAEAAEERARAAEVARQQAAEDTIALNMRVVATGDDLPHLPQGPIIGLPHCGGRGQETNAERRIRCGTKTI